MPSLGSRQEVVFAPLKAERRTWKHAFRVGWVWGKDTTAWFVRETSRLDLARPVLHLCCGGSKLGDVRVDAFHPAANLRADMFHLPFRDGAFPVVIVDPPYELNLHERLKLGREVARIHAPGGRLLWKAPWLPPEGNYIVHDVTVQSIRAGLPRNAHLLVRAIRRFPKDHPKPAMKKARDRRGPCIEDRLTAFPGRPGSASAARTGGAEGADARGHLSLTPQGAHVDAEQP